MHALARINRPLQMLVAVGAGVTLGAYVGSASSVEGASSPLAHALKLGCELGAFGTLAILRALAIPLIVTSLVLGGVGLEAMRGMGRLVAKTLAWIVGSTLLAVVIGFATAWYVGKKLVVAYFEFGSGSPAGRADPSTWQWGWIGLVVLGLGFGYYRNQIEEGHGRLLTRFCQGVEEMTLPLLRWTRALSAVGIFFLIATTTAQHVPFVSKLAKDEPGLVGPFYTYVALVLVGAVSAYFLALSLVVWCLARVNPWRLFGALTPALWVAAAGQSTEAALPLTLDALRGRAGVSNRVAGPVLTICTVLHRDGIALLWVMVMLCLGNSHQPGGSWGLLAATAFAGMLLGCGGGTLASRSGLTPLLAMVSNNTANPGTLPMVLGLIVMTLGGAISVFSHACATLVIARSEGEYWVPGPQPASEEIQGLINQQALAES